MIPLLPVITAAFLAAAAADADSAASVDTTGAAIPTYTMPAFRIDGQRAPITPIFPGSRTVLGREWLEFQDPGTLGEALRPVAGTRVLSAGDGVSRTVSIRGLGADRTAVLLDGQLLNTAQGGGVDLTPIDMENLSRIEVARGAVGALYGPYAMGGAVNLVRRNDRNPVTTFRMLGGTENRLSLRGLAGIGDGRWTLDGSFRLETLAPELNGQRSQARGGGVQGRLTHYPTWASALELGVEHRLDDRDVPGSRDFPTPSANREDQFSSVTLSARGIKAGGGILESRVSAASMERRYQDPLNPLGAIEDRHENQKKGMDVGWKTRSATLSMDLRGEVGSDALESTTDGNRRRNRAAAAGLVGLELSDWQFSGALRWDALEHFQPHPTVRAGVSRTLVQSDGGTKTLRAHLDMGTSFRPPTFDDLFWPARASAAGNPHLQPEHSVDMNLGLEFRSGSRFSSALTAFTSRVRDLIQWVPGADGVWRPHNVGQANLRGIELDGLWDMRQGGLPLQMNWALSFLSATDGTGDPVTGNKQLVGRASQTAFAEVNWFQGDWVLDLGLRAVSKVPLTAANTKWFDGYALWHAGVRWHLSTTTRLELEGRNLFDTPYEDLRGYATPGRELLVGMRFTPGGR